MQDWEERAVQAAVRYGDGITRLPQEPDERQRQLTRIGNAAWAAGLSLHMLGRPAEGDVWLRRAAERYRESWPDAPPGSWGRPIGAMKARLVAGDLEGARLDAEWALGAGACESETPIGRYLQSLQERFPGPVVADMLCYLRVYLELSIKVKGLLLMRDAGFEIENYLELKRDLISRGHVFQSVTDTEVVAHLVQEEWKDDGLEGAVRRAMSRARGLFALVMLSADDPDKLDAVRNGPPIVVGLGDGEYFVASDVPAILAHTRNVVFMDDREMVVVTRDGARFSSLDGTERGHAPTRVTWDPVMAEKAGFKHFMLKEIYEQPRAIRDTLIGRYSLETGRAITVPLLKAALQPELT